MKSFFDLTFRPFFVLTGLATALVGVYAIWPRQAIESIQTIAFIREYTIFVQHWGFMVGMVGVFMIVAAYRSDWRIPILVYGALEKTFIVYLTVVNMRHPYSQGFWLGAGIDATVVIYIVVYFISAGASSPLARSRNTTTVVHQAPPPGA